MSREIGSGQTTEQRTRNTLLLLLSFPAYCMSVVPACWWRGFHVQDSYGLCCWSVGGV
jgi:hypothetical protein